MVLFCLAFFSFFGIFLIKELVGSSSFFHSRALVGVLDAKVGVSFFPSQIFLSFKFSCATIGWDFDLGSVYKLLCKIQD